MLRSATITLLFTDLWIYALSLPHCNRIPDGMMGPKSHAGNKFRIEITPFTSAYIPGQIYTVILQGTHNILDQFPYQFRGFTLTVERETHYGQWPDSDGPSSAGVFKLKNDGKSKISDACHNMVVHTSRILKSEIETYWIAPQAGTGCVLFRAAVVGQDVWYMDDGGLTLRLCENTDASTYPILEYCQTCDEAKYELRFEGLWTRQSHPKQFPDNIWLTGFSDVIGASHSADYRLWSLEEPASPGIVEFIETGSTARLESDIKGNKSRTLIKAKGITHPNATGKTFAVFRVDPQHHLLSLVSIIRPSPDWFVGISALELCLENGSWIQHKSLDLFPFDFGLYNGVTYTSKGIKLDKLENIFQIAATFPNDTDSPFYDSSGEDIKPLAKIHLIRQRRYEKTNCQVAQESEDCADNDWVEYEPCNTTCGVGTKISRRRYKIRSDDAQCKIDWKKEDCSSQIDCGDKEGTTRVPDAICQPEEWGNWSECTTPCRRYKVQFRHLDANLMKACSQSSVPNLEHVVPCDTVEKCEGYQDDDESCVTSSWTTFSPCSRECTRYRTREIDQSRPECIEQVEKEEIRCQDCMENNQ